MLFCTSTPVSVIRPWRVNLVSICVFVSYMSAQRVLNKSVFFAWTDKLMNALPLCRWRFYTKKLCNRILSSSEVNFFMENCRFAFLSPPLEGGLRRNVRCSS